MLTPLTVVTFIDLVNIVDQHNYTHMLQVQCTGIYYMIDCMLYKDACNVQIPSILLFYYMMSSGFAW